MTSPVTSAAVRGPFKHIQMSGYLAPPGVPVASRVAGDNTSYGAPGFVVVLSVWASPLPFVYG